MTNPFKELVVFQVVAIGRCVYVEVCVCQFKNLSFSQLLPSFPLLNERHLVPAKTFTIHMLHLKALRYVVSHLEGTMNTLGLAGERRHTVDKVWSSHIPTDSYPAWI